MFSNKFLKSLTLVFPDGESNQRFVMKAWFKFIPATSIRKQFEADQASLPEEQRRPFDASTAIRLAMIGVVSCMDNKGNHVFLPEGVDAASLTQEQYRDAVLDHPDVGEHLCAVLWDEYRTMLPEVKKGN